MLTATPEEMTLAQARGGQERLLVEFYMGTQRNAQKSAEAGRDIVDDVPRIRIMVPGDKSSIVDRVVWDAPNNPRSDTRRFPQAWAAFRNGVSSQQVSGTPLEKLPGITKGQVQELAFFGVKTVEHLAGMSDGHAQKFMDGARMKARAQAWLEAAAGNAPLEKMRSELEQRDSLIAKQAEALAALEARLAAVEAAPAEAPKRGPGRPPKSAQE